MFRLTALAAAGSISLVAATGTLTGFCQPAAAAVAPLDRSWINESTTWLVHVDVERLLKTELGQFLARELEQAEAHADPEANADDNNEINIEIRIGDDDQDAPHLQGKQGMVNIESLIPSNLKEFRDKYGFDPLKDVLSFTIFGGEVDDEPQGLLIRTTAAIDNALKELESAEGVDLSQMNGTTVAQLDTGDQEDTPRYVAVRPEPDGTRIMFLAKSLEELATTLTARGKGNAPMWAAPAPDSFLYIRAVKDSPIFVETDRSELLRGVEAVELNIGQRGDRVFMVGDLETGTNEVASNIAAVGQGLIAVARLGAMGQEIDAETKAMLDLLRNLTISAKDTSVHLDFSFEAGKLINLIEAEADSD